MLLAGGAAAQISPGPLSKAHSFLSGPTQCTTCHRPAAGKATFKCLPCHTEIAGRLAAGRGLHASFLGKADTGQQCVRCHSEHNGEEFQLVRWDPSPGAFEHGKTGYPLEGKHAGLACSRCHSPEHISPDERRTIQVKDLHRTFLGVSRECSSCHQDKHRGQLGHDCRRCHTFADWKTVSRFDHSTTRFPLTGNHARVACQKCHQPVGGPEGAIKYVGLAFDRCTVCHADPHRGAFPNSCQSCHSTSNWKRVSLGDRFDHSKTKYPLQGRHASVDCLQCHAGGDFKKPVAFQKCADCHRPDPHSGQFAKRADGGDCAACHTVDGFKPARFGLREHAATLYPLEGKHASVACARCHIPAGRNTLYKLKSDLCTRCHADQHQGQFATAPHFNRCQTCHSLQGYRPATFTLLRHKETRFPLTGGHIAVACVDCHRQNQDKKLPVVYRFEDRSCTVCHADPHRGQFRERMRKLRADGSVAGCEACHSTGSWRDLASFDHSTTTFSLTGVHRAAACTGCHRPPSLGTTLKEVDFRSAPTHCESCHEDSHAGQFAKAGSTRCAECHNSARWKPSLFDHETRTMFPLQGPHRDVRCSACHSATKLIQDRPVVFYKPTPTKCAACHTPA